MTCREELPPGYVTPVLLDSDRQVAATHYRVLGTPTVYLVDRRGRLVAQALGPVDWRGGEARRLVERLLAQ